MNLMHMFKTSQYCLTNTMSLHAAQRALDNIEKYCTYKNSNLVL